jgi:6-phosphogluconolactonase
MDRQSLIGLNHYINKNGVVVIEAPTTQKANEITLEMLQKYCDFKTALFLSGGSTPKKLYELIASEKTLKSGSVGLIDERYGEKNHKHSNELMIKGTGIIEYFENMNIRFYPILEEKEIADTARDYDEALRFVLKYFPKSVGILGVGADGHTAGIPTNPEIVRKMEEDQSALVDFYELEKYGQRITLNFHGLAMLDLIIVLVLGQEKREILKTMFLDGSIEDLPARFYLKPEIAKKTIIVTDQIV